MTASPPARRSLALPLWCIAGALMFKAGTAVFALFICLGPFTPPAREKACSKLLPALGRAQAGVAEAVLRVLLQCPPLMGPSPAGGNPPTVASTSGDWRTPTTGAAPA